jgi:hypothetical protein
MPDQKIKWTRTAEGYQSKDERFTLTKHTGRAYTRGPFRNWWDVLDTRTGRGHNSLPSLVEAKAWAEDAALSASGATEQT